MDNYRVDELKELINNFLQTQGESIIACVLPHTKEIYSQLDQNQWNDFCWSGGFIWTENYVLFMHEYDDMYNLHYIPRNPVIPTLFPENSCGCFLGGIAVP